ncbi:DUF808 domain-containing protein [Motiliproteus sediminis]|uniref:DUF808 domain-containing protein n=1 Tax=Motiliproteus sediminis TaxID=1468178 RepID=UPI001AF01EC4|nr:DUF808 domain-containing protein [Motiliproteus sediminis]
MAGANLLALIDDIATLLDDIAVLSKVAAKKTAGVLGDDLALSAEQVSGVRAERELPVVWAVAKGSFKNKLILIPAAMLISAVAPWAVTLLLMIGGLYLCFEGAEKLAHKFLHDTQARRQQQLQAVRDPHVDLVNLEQQKIKGAIRTDFILSAEIIIIALGSIQDAPLLNQLLIVCGLGVLFTVGVYGLVAAIVKLDDAGLYLLESAGDQPGLKRSLGAALLRAAPGLMKLLSIVGTAAMFLVGGSILVHGLPFAHHWLEAALHAVEGIALLPLVVPVLLDGLAGMVAGTLVLAIVAIASHLKRS